MAHEYALPALLRLLLLPLLLAGFIIEDWIGNVPSDRCAYSHSRISIRSSATAPCN
jgi:hypothetical protein